MADAAEQWVTVATRLTEARVNELALVLTARGVPYQRQAGQSAAGSSGCRSAWRPRRRPSSPSIGTRTRGRSARGRSRKSARAGPASSGTSPRCWPCSSRCTRTSSIAIGSAPAGSKRGRCSAANGGAPSRRSRCTSSSTTSAAISPSARSSATSSAGTSAPASAGWPCCSPQEAPTCSTRGRRGRRTVRSARRLRCSPRSVCSWRTRGGAASCAIRRGGHASRRSSRGWAC